MGEALTTEEFLRWQQYYAQEPFGFHREESRFSQVMAAIFSANGVGRKEGFTSPDHWRYQPPSDKPEITPEAAWEAFKQSLR